MAAARFATGKLTGKTLAAETKSPSFLAIHPNHKFLYPVNEGGTEATKKGAIAAFALDPKTGELKMLNEKTSGGDSPCHLIVDAKGKNVLAANYGGGSVTDVPIKDDGSLGERNDVAEYLDGRGWKATTAVAADLYAPSGLTLAAVDDEQAPQMPSYVTASRT